MADNRKIRIKDIANKAGVSEGTVDRVIHKRGEVSEKSRIAVEKVMNELNYTPNILARSLASKKQYHFLCLIPSYKTGEYWELVDKGFDLAAEEFGPYNVVIQKKYFDQFDPLNFTYQSSFKNAPDAVFISPIFKNETENFVAILDRHNIPYSFIDSMLESTNFTTYYGQHSIQSGYIGAKLLLNKMKPDSKILVIRTQRKQEGVSNQTIARYKGFSNCLTEFNNSCKLIELLLSEHDEVLNNELLDNIFEQHPDIKGSITFNSKVCRLAKYIHATNKNITLIGYDALEDNIYFLKEGVISYLIAQRPEAQAFLSIQDMCNKLIFQKEITKINYVPIDILMKENIDYYVNFKDKY